jgi:transposase
MAAAEPLDTIWEASDELWARVEPILLADAPPARTGRPRKPWRPILNAVIFRLRSGCQWNQLPERFGDDSTAHRWFSRWCKNGVFEKVWAAVVRECEELGGVEWRWQAADGRMGKARFGGARSGPTRRTGARTAPRPVC